MEDSQTNNSADQKLLQDLVIGNPDLETLESLLDHFNIFEAMGAVKQEVRHSDFLAYLLNPNQNHGLGDVFVKRLLQKSVMRTNIPLTISPIDLDVWDMGSLVVRREWRSVDISLIDELHKLVVIIENKIFSGEHSDQLSRYIHDVKQQYPDYQILGLYLTPEGDEPSNPNYIAISYMLICELVEDLIEARTSTLGQGILTMMNHYTVMLRRFIVGESEIERLCKQIYNKHQRALDLIYEYRPDQQAEISDFLCELIKSDSRFELDHKTKSYIQFIPRAWDSPRLKRGNGWTRSGRILMLQFNNFQQSLKLVIVLGPGPDADRESLFEEISQNEPPFKRSLKALGKFWSTVYTRNFLSKSSCQNKSTEELHAEIMQRWQDFIQNELPKFNQFMKKITWIWEE